MTLLRRRLACQELVELAGDYLEGAISGSLARAVERHLAGCADCANYLEQLRLTVWLTGGLRIDDVPEEIVEVFQRAWDDEHRD
jgi:anti-sigma factor RsiW